MASPVSDGQHVYVADKNILRCYDAASGERIYQSRIPGLGMVNASPIIIGSSILMIDEEGKSVMVRTGQEMKVVATGDLGDTVWATPAVANNAIYVRGINGLYCIAAPPG